jgi:hypothetical protein
MALRTPGALWFLFAGVLLIPKNPCGSRVP